MADSLSSYGPPTLDGRDTHQQHETGTIADSEVNIDGYHTTQSTIAIVAQGDKSPHIRDRNSTRELATNAAPEEADAPSIASEATSAAQNRNRHNLALNANAPPQSEEGMKSETSSVIPTSARLSIATSTYPLTQPNYGHNTDSIGTMLDGILANPGWSAAAEERRRRNSLFSMRSLAPTLPPYEEYRNDLPVLAPGPSDAGPSGLRQQMPGNSDGAGDKKRGYAEIDYNGNAGNSEVGGRSNAEDADIGSVNAEAGPLVDTEHDPENALTAHYSRIVRTIDSRYTSELARLHQEIESMHESHMREIAKMRNDMDASYRSVLKLRDQEVERAREEAASRSEELEQIVKGWKAEVEEKVERAERQAAEKEDVLVEAHGRRMERARHEVEDVWERRWRDRMGLVDEEVNRRIRKRDEEWLTFLQRECPDVLEVAKVEMMSPVNISPISTMRCGP